MNRSIIPILPEVEAKIITCGPLRISGRIRIVMPDGHTLTKHRTFICRCGKSKTIRSAMAHTPCNIRRRFT